MDEALAVYKSLAQMERAFRSLTTERLEVPPEWVYNADRVSGHASVCLPAHYVE